MTENPPLPRPCPLSCALMGACCPCFGGGASAPPNGAKKQTVGKMIQTRDCVGMINYCQKVRSNGNGKPTSKFVALADALQLCAEMGDPNARTSSGTYAFHEAVRCKQMEIVQELLRVKAMGDLQDSKGQTPLDLAKSKKDPKLEAFLEREIVRQKTVQFTGMISFLQTVPVFSSLAPADYPKLANAFTERIVTPGQHIIHQGEVGDEFFVIEKGTADVLVDDKKVNSLGPCDFFGEVALLRGQRRNASIKATSEMKVNVLSRVEFDRLDLRNKLHFRRRKAIRAQGGEEHTNGHTGAGPGAESALVRTAMCNNQKLAPLLRVLTQSDLDTIVKHYFPVTAAAGQEVMKQGDLKADLFYVVAEGTLDFVVDGSKVGMVSTGGSFGELALMYRAPRAATVVARTQTRLWACAASNFKKAFEAPLRAKLEGYATLLSQVDLFKDVSDKDRAVLADAMVEKTYFDGENIIKQGEDGQSFFLLVTGQVSVEVDGKEVARLTGEKGQQAKKAICFGERALLNDEPRAATVRVVSKTAMILALDRLAFQAVMEAKEGNTSSQTGPTVLYKREKLKTIGLLGCGAFGAVTLTKDPSTNNTFALKAISKGHVYQTGWEAALNEKVILRMITSPFLIRLAATFNSKEYLYFLLEPAMGGELFTVYQRSNLFGKESLAIFYIACVLRALEHLHERYVCYRDLKTENLLLDRSGYLKVTDFGLAKIVMGHTFTLCGTPEYLAPEIVSKTGYTAAVDWWALGVLTYELMVGETPFAASDSMAIFHNILAGIEQVQFPFTGSWSGLVIGLCKKVPSERLPMRTGGSKNVEEHKWFAKHSFDWEALNARRMRPPHVPSLANDEDLGQFDALEQDRPPTIPYVDPGTGWDDNFEDVRGPAKFD